MKIEELISKFIGDIYYKDSIALKKDFIGICESFNQEFSNADNTYKVQKTMEELFSVFNTNDFIVMADYLNSTLMKKILTM